MEDKFKLRFYDELNKKMTYVDLIELYGYDSINKHNNDFDYSKFPSSIWLKCTGLKDKHGTLIYEGDIVKNIYNNVSIVKFGNYAEVSDDFFTGLGFYVDDNESFVDQESITMIDLNKFEMIGNIYENPELLKGD